MAKRAKKMPEPKSAETPTSDDQQPKAPTKQPEPAPSVMPRVRKLCAGGEPGKAAKLMKDCGYTPDEFHEAVALHPAMQDLLR